MAALEIWYRQRPSDDFEEGDPALRIETAEELDALLDRVIRDGHPGPVWPVLEVSQMDDPLSPTLEAGLGEQFGFLHYMSANEDTWTIGDPATEGDVAYNYSGHVREVPASAEVPVRRVRDGLREFLESSTKPQSVSWWSRVDQS